MMALLRRYLRWRNGRDGRKPAITRCCDNGVELKLTGDEFVVVCSGCGTYIGHIMGRNVALLGLRFKDHLANVVERREIGDVLFPSDLDDMCDTYIKLLHEWAPSAVEEALEAHIPAERS